MVLVPRHPSVGTRRYCWKYFSVNLDFWEPFPYIGIHQRLVGTGLRRTSCWQHPLQVQEGKPILSSKTTSFGLKAFWKELFSWSCPLSQKCSVKYFDSNPTLRSPASTRPLRLLLRAALYQVLPKVPKCQPGGSLRVFGELIFSSGKFLSHCLLWSLLWPLRPLWRPFCLLSRLVCGKPIVES